jgi:chromosomal replication initiator protein
MREIWKSVQDYVKDRISPGEYQVWINPLLPLSLEKHTIEVEVPNKFFEDWLRQNYLVLVREALLAALGRECEIIFRLRKSPMPQRRITRSAPIDKTKRVRDFRFNKTYTFDNFVVGPSNQFANAACLAVANLPAKNYNPLFIYGGVGLGKTHLLNAIGNHVIENGVIPNLNSLTQSAMRKWTNSEKNSGAWTCFSSTISNLLRERREHRRNSFIPSIRSTTRVSRLW